MKMPFPDEEEAGEKIQWSGECCPIDQIFSGKINFPIIIDGMKREGEGERVATFP